MKKPVVIGSHSFPTQSSALNHFKVILNRGGNNTRIDDPSDHADLVALIERHDQILESDDKPPKGAGQIAHFERRFNGGDGYNTLGFWIVRRDGTETDFSYGKAVRGKLKE